MLAGHLFLCYSVLTEFHLNYVIAFPGGVGTAGMVRLAGEHNIPVWEPCGVRK